MTSNWPYVFLLMFGIYVWLSSVLTNHAMPLLLMMVTSDQSDRTSILPHIMKVILYVMYKFKINGMFLRQYTFHVSVYHMQAASLKLVFIICNEGCYGLMNCTIIGVMYGWLIGPYLAKLYQHKKLLELELYNGLLFYTGIGLCGFIKLK